MLYSLFILSTIAASAVRSDPILNPQAETIDKDPWATQGKSAEICSCGLKVIVNGTDSFFLKSPNYTSDPCIWEFHVLAGVSVEINCFIHGIKGTQVSPSSCSPKEDSFTIQVNGETEAHCNPFHHFAKFIENSLRDEGFIIYMNFKRRQSIEMEGQSFECSINGNFVGPKPSVKLSELKDLTYEKFDRDDLESSLNNPICGQTNLPERKIKHGEIISPEEYPWIVPLSIEGDKLCGGTILGHHWVLTSAHCVAKAHWAKIYFGVREYGFYEETQTSQEFIIHPDYAFPRHDLALIKLPKRLAYNRFVHPVCLPSREASKKMEYKGFGWSTISDDETGASRYLRGTVLEEMSIEECRSRYTDSIFGHEILCTNSTTHCLEEHYQDREAEFSPSILGQMESNRFVLHGVASFSSNGCNKDYPIGFTRLYPHVDWIIQHITNSSTAVQLLPIFDVLDHGF